MNNTARKHTTVDLDAELEIAKARLARLDEERATVAQGLAALESIAKLKSSHPPAMPRRPASGQRPAVRIADLVVHVLQGAGPEGLTLDRILELFRTQHPTMNILSIGSQVYKMAADGILRSEGPKGKDRVFKLGNVKLLHAR